MALGRNRIKSLSFSFGHAFFKNLTKHGLKVADVIMPIKSQLKIKYAKIQGFTEYVLKTYFEGNFLLHVWNHLLFQ